MHIIESIIFGNSGTWAVISAILYIIGLCRIFQKSDVPGWKAVIPCYREYCLGKCAGKELESSRINMTWIGLGKCAGKELESRTIAISQFILTAANIATILVQNENTRLFIAVVAIMVWIVGFVYSIQIYNSLIDVYNVQKRCLWLWILAEPVPALVWGFNDKYQPSWKAGEFRDNAVSHVQGGEVADMGEGLTVNLNKREVPDGLFRKKYC